jgi:hypothetical protein
MKRRTELRDLLILSLLLGAGTTAAAQEQEEAVPAGVEMLMARGGIPAIFEPEFVPAADAEIPDDAWVFGVEIGGVAKAYSLNLLNHHEVVNDESAGQPFATVW